MGEVRGCFWVPWEGLGWWGTPLWASIHQKHHDGSHLASRRHPTCAVSPREKTWFPGVSPGRAGVYAFCTFTRQNGHSRIHQRFLPSRAGVYAFCIFTRQNDHSRIHQRFLEKLCFCLRDSSFPSGGRWPLQLEPPGTDDWDR